MNPQVVSTLTIVLMLAVVSVQNPFDFEADTIETNVFRINDNVSFNTRVNADARCE